jgi:hypothetical protein
MLNSEETMFVVVCLLFGFLVLLLSAVIVMEVIDIKREN